MHLIIDDQLEASGVFWRSNENVRNWPEAADRECPRIGRDQGQTGRFMLGMSLSARDPSRTYAIQQRKKAPLQWHPAVN
jgi:hypothetical protein